MLSFLVIFAIIIAFAAAATPLRIHPVDDFVPIKEGLVAVEHESTRRLPLTPGWSLEKDAEPTATVSFSLWLRQQNLARLDAVFWAVSDPVSPRYGQHMSLADVSELVKTSDADWAVLQAHLDAHNLKVIDVVGTGDMARVSGRVADVERAFNVDIEQFVHTAGHRVVRTRDVPRTGAAVADVIDAVIGLHGVPIVPKRTAKFVQPGAKRAAPLIGPADLRARYNVTAGDVGGKSNVTFAVAEFQGQYYSPSDLEAFFAKFVMQKPKPVVVKGDANDPSSPGIEAELDIQYQMGIAPGIAEFFYEQASFDFFSGLDKWVSLINSDAAAPQVHSVSYGTQGFSQPSEAVKQRFDTEMQKLGARGISVLISSGDSGAGCDFCIWEQPAWPSTTPFVTAVGATRFLSGTSGPEGSVQEFGSGGGFSWDIPRMPLAQYQDAAVKNYITLNAGKLPFQFRWNKDGRATPDVSALGIGYSVVVNGQIDSIGGTSASSPTVSALVALINDERVAAGKSTLGFLNPFFYKAALTNASAFFDVTVGDNSDSCCFGGFPAAPGWDASSGIGTPNYVVLKAMAMALP